MPALYRDEDWAVPKQRLDRAQIDAYRGQVIGPQQNRALAACADFPGDVLLVQSEHDRIVPAQVIDNYRGAFERARSVAYRVLEGADHGLSEPRAQQVYTTMLCEWLWARLREAREASHVRDRQVRVAPGDATMRRSTTPPSTPG